MLSVEQAFARRISNVPLTASGWVTKILSDDHEGPHHQRFVFEIHSGHTILVAHNLERAYRVPVKLGDKIEVHGTYVWNKYGGILHNTHHSDRGEHEDGYVIFVGKKSPHDYHSIHQQT